jgi:hypothetical protein
VKLLLNRGVKPLSDTGGTSVRAEKNPKREYSAPKLTVIGSLHELTMTPKIGMKTDGMFLFNPIVNASP